MTIRPPFSDLVSWLRTKPQGHFRIEKIGSGFVITVHRVGCPPVAIPCRSYAEANRSRLVFSDEGLAGYVAGGWM